jgi:hypothetical protein
MKDRSSAPTSGNSSSLAVHGDDTRKIAHVRGTDYFPAANDICWLQSHPPVDLTQVTLKPYDPIFIADKTTRKL